MESICVIGLGYIGLPTASLLATKGYNVLGVDVRKDIVKALNDGDVLIHEPGLDIMVKSGVSSGRLKASEQAVKADVFILALPTPFKENKKPDLSYVEEGVKEIAPYLEPGAMVILESTSPVGTTEKICEWFHAARPDLHIPGFEGGKGEQLYIAHCPERVLPGRILQELVQNDRIVGGVDKPSTDKAAKFYRNFVEGAVLTTNSREAELAKLVENSFRDVNIAFANEISLICDELNADVWETIRLANRHPRVNILEPGTGVGGHCISVDPWFLVDALPERARLIRAAREVNDSKANWVYDHIVHKAERFTRPVIACMGLAFKPNVDDLRESPALHVTQKLAAHANWEILVVEPHIAALPPELADKVNVKLCDIPEALAKADIFAFLVKHAAFSEIAMNDLFEKIIIDPCGLYKNSKA